MRLTANHVSLAFAALALGACANSTSTTSASSGGEVPETAVNACIQGVKDRVGHANVTVVEAKYDESESMVLLDDDNEEARWRCMVSNDGAVSTLVAEGKR